MKKLLAVILTLAFALGLTACGSGDGGSSDGEVSVFYYTYSDAYISSVRSAMDKFLKDAGLKFQNYDANGNQTTQTEHYRPGKSEKCSGNLLQPFCSGIGCNQL